jgi:LytS/YehU family sensor histidine kinase
MDENVGSAKKSIEKLSELLRYQLYDQQQMVPVSQELQYLENFIELQKVRSSDKLKVNMNMGESLNGQLIYPLLFLPLVENAFKYVGGQYLIEIEAALQEEKITFKVKNTVPDRQIAPKKESGIGLENLKRRLDLLYPGQHFFAAGLDSGTYTAEFTLNINHER